AEARPESDYVMDDFDEMLNKIPLLNDYDIDSSPQGVPSAAAVCSRTNAPAGPSTPVHVEVGNTLNVMAAMASSATTSKARNVRDLKVAGIKRTRKYQASQWDQRFRELTQFQADTGHMFVPHSYPANQKLAQWVKR
ncbi:MAG: hypothetical protein SGILL_005190, partial [Bacillariaceae sp.]